MIRFAEGNLLDAKAEALVNTVNTVGVMGKGIALMFKEVFPDNFRAYAAACKVGKVRTGRVFVTERQDLVNGPRWIVNFPTKQHWRSPSRIEWVRDGLADLRQFVNDTGVRSIALPPLGSGNGGLDWDEVRPMIEDALSALDAEIIVYEPSRQYRNVAKRSGAEALTPSRALVAELVRRYGVMGFDCSLLEIQKLAYFAERACEKAGSLKPFDFGFTAGRYGPYAQPLGHLLNRMDGSYLHCQKRIPDAGPSEPIWFDETRRSRLDAYLASAGKDWLPVLDDTEAIVDGFEYPLCLELLATVDWVIAREGVSVTLSTVRAAIAAWPFDDDAARRKARLFDDRLIELALQRLSDVGLVGGVAAA